MIFRKELAELILDGKKTATRRRMNDNPRSPWFRGHCGYDLFQVFTINPGRGKKRVASAEVTCVYPQALKLMADEDARKEGFDSLDAFKEAWRQINGTFDPREYVWVVEFGLVDDIPQRRKILKRFTAYRGGGQWLDALGLPEDHLNALVDLGFLTRNTFPFHDRISYKLTDSGRAEARKA